MRLADAARSVNEQRIVPAARHGDDRVGGADGELVARAHLEAGARERRRRPRRRRRRAQRALEQLLGFGDAIGIAERVVRGERARRAERSAPRDRAAW